MQLRKKTDLLKKNSNQSEPARKRKKTVEWILPTIIIPEESAVQFATDLLASTLPTMSIQEEIPAPPSSTAGASDAPILEHTMELLRQVGPGHC